MQRADAINVRTVFVVYAVAAGVAGLALVVWPGNTGALPFVGAAVIAMGCMAAAMAGVEDPVGVRRGLQGLVAAHGIVCLVAVFRQNGLIRDAVFMLLFGVFVILGYLWSTADGEPREVRLWTSLLRRSRNTEQLRSVYEQHIREAARQEERNRLARDLHDAIKQQIFVIQTSAATVQARFVDDPPGAQQAVQQVRDAARDAMTEMQTMLDHLRAAPLENTGLVAALKQQCEALGFRTGARVECRIGSLPPSDALDPGAAESMYRVAQEALANVGRHARAKNVEVTLDTVGQQFELRVKDDGAGFDTNAVAGGMGLRNMRERAQETGGDFEIWSRPGAGTTVMFTVPCELRAAEEYKRYAVVQGALACTSIVLAIVVKSRPFAIVAAIATLSAFRQLRAYRIARGPAR